MRPEYPQGTQQHFVEEVYDRYKIPLLHVIHKYVKQKDACEDIFQEVLVRIIKHAQMLSEFPRPKLEAYIFLIARGVSIDYLRSVNRKEELTIESDVVLNLLNRTVSQGADQPDSILKTELFLMMEEIPAEDRILLIGKYYLGLSTAELIEFVGGSSATVRSRIFRAKKKLFEQWSRADLKLEDFLDG